VFDFISQTPEALHMVTLVFGPRGIPRATAPSRASA
jgi:catalase